MPSSKPHPPVVGKVTHHSIELYWDLEKKAKRRGPQEQWCRFSIEEEDPKMHTYGIIYTGYATKHVVEGLEPRTLYRFRLKVTSPSGECEYSPLVSVSTTRDIWLGGMCFLSEHFHRAVNVNDEDLLVRILQGGHVKVDVPNKFGFTALMVAAQKGYIRWQLGWRLTPAAWHLEDLSGLSAGGKQVQGCACPWEGRVDVVDTGSGWTPLMRVSAVSGNQRVASLLIEAGANVNVKDRNGKTPLMSVVSLLEERKKKQRPEKSPVC
uniref:Fibronectin type III and ankyrin repeat domains 1 n=1 Tax=Saimiri boliviensis boliviensis TaxID=39432 RepID=A0A2K6SQA1_SAIBB